LSLQEKLLEEMKAAMKAGEKIRLSAIRLLRARLKDAEIAKGGELTPDEEIGVLTSTVKRHKDSIRSYEEAGREDLVAKEKEELAVVESYLPEQLSEEEIDRFVSEVIERVEAVSVKDLGKVMSEAMKELRGKADGRLVQDLVRRKLG
jgi:uncharacterized protein YqeY